MGASDVVPGVSGGTIAFIFGIYEELINAIRSFDLKGLKLLLSLKIQLFLERISWQFLLSVGLGILAAIFSLSRVLGWLLQNRPVFIWAFFLGLILASIVSIGRRVKTWQPSTWACLTGGITGAYFLAGLVPVCTPDAPWFLFLCGAIAICAMILPGISGSYILVLFGKYQYVLEAVNHRNFFVLALVAAGAGAGIIMFSRLLGWLLKNHHDLMVAMLAGLMLGSLRKVWPWKETIEGFVDIHGKSIPSIQANILPAQWNGEVYAAVSLIAAGFLLMFIVDRISSR